jgi:tRNA (guanosine-2'-O-)-methyltransferase
MLPDAALSIVRALAPAVSATRLQRIAGALNARVRDTALLFENVADAGNVSACVRTAEALGVQHVFVVDRWSESWAAAATAKGAAGRSTDRGAGKWLTTRRFGALGAALDAARREGYAVHATDLSPGALDIDASVAASLRAGGAAVGAAAAGAAAAAAAGATAAAPATRPRVLLAFGNEHRGCSRALLAAADVRFALPQRGMVQSLNLSVAAALALHQYLRRTPDYYYPAGGVASLLLHRHELAACGEGSSGVVVATSPPAPADDAASVAAAQLRLARAARQPAPPAGVEAVLALLQAGSGGGGGGGSDGGTGAPAGPSSSALRVEGLPASEKLELLARFLMADVPSAARILASAGVRPADY